MIQNLPKVVNKFHLELLRVKTEAIKVVEERDVQMVDSKDVTSQPDSLQDDQSTLQTNTSDTVMVY